MNLKLFQYDNYAILKRLQPCNRTNMLILRHETGQHSSSKSKSFMYHISYMIHGISLVLFRILTSFSYENYAKIHGFQAQLVSVMAIFTFDIDVQIPNISYMIHDLSVDLDHGKI